MEAQTTTKRKWTALKLFCVGGVGFFVSLACVILAALLWWPLAFSWESDHLPIPAYFDIGFGIIGILGVIASVVVIIASGIKALLSHGKPAA